MANKKRRPIPATNKDEELMNMLIEVFGLGGALEAMALVKLGRGDGLIDARMERYSLPPVPSHTRNLKPCDVVNLSCWRQSRPRSIKGGQADG